MKNNVTILIVDDEEVMRGLLQKILHREGYNVVIANDGADAVDILKNQDVDIIISDIKMPNMNGFELLQHVKNNLNNISIIMMTAFGDSYTVKDALLLGADEYITKPFKSFEITLVVERAYWRLLSSRNDKKQLVK